MFYNERAKRESEIAISGRNLGGERNFEWQEEAGHRMATSMNAWQIKLQEEAGGDRGGGYK
jgi:hypothetical protein